MSSEESYLAILRYLTNEREPYAPGTEGNAKRKIRKAAACYVVRGGTLYYQRRQRDQQRFAELEVVLQAERRARLIRAAHLAPDGAHRTRLQTWQGLSQKYWWRGERRGGGRDSSGSQGYRRHGTGPRPDGSRVSPPVETHSLSGQPVPAHSHLYSFPRVHVELPVLYFLFARFLLCHCLAPPGPCSMHLTPSG